MKGRKSNFITNFFWKFIESRGSVGYLNLLSYCQYLIDNRSRSKWWTATARYSPHNVVKVFKISHYVFTGYINIIDFYESLWWYWWYVTYCDLVMILHIWNTKRGVPSLFKNEESETKLRTQGSSMRLKIFCQTWISRSY